MCAVCNSANRQTYSGFPSPSYPRPEERVDCLALLSFGLVSKQRLDDRCNVAFALSHNVRCCIWIHRLNIELASHFHPRVQRMRTRFPLQQRRFRVDRVPHTLYFSTHSVIGSTRISSEPATHSSCSTLAPCHQLVGASIASAYGLVGQPAK